MPIKLKEWRQHLGVAQLELAAKSGVGWAAMKCLEQESKVRVAQPGTRRRLAEALGITPVDIIASRPSFDRKRRSNRYN